MRKYDINNQKYPFQSVLVAGDDFLPSPTVSERKRAINKNCEN